MRRWRDPYQAATALVALVAVVALMAGCSGEESSAPTPAPPSPQPSDPDAAPAELPTPRTEVAGAVLDGALYVVGGLTADGAASALAHRFDPAANAWTELPPLPVALHHAGVTAAAGRIWVVGGYTDEAGGWRELDRTFTLHPDAAAWEEGPPLPEPRGALGVAAVGSTLVAFGGTSGGRVLASAAILDAAEAGGRWRAGPDMATPREHTAAAASGGRVYAIAGRQGSLESNLRSVESLDPSRPSEGWRPEPQLVETRGGIGAAAVSGRPCVAGGEEPGGTIATVECLAGGAWEVAARLQRPRHGLAVLAHDGRLHVVAGGEQPGLFVSGAHEVLAPEGG